MADFSTNVGGNQGAAPQPLQPVQDRSQILALNSLADIGGKVLSAGAAIIQKDQAQEQQKALNTLVSGFAQKQVNIASAVETGAISSQEGRMRMRTNYTEAISNNPGLVDVLAKTQKEIVSTAGLGSVVVEGTDQEKMFRGQVKDAVDSGWVKANATPEEQQAGVAARTSFLRHQEDLKAAHSQLSYDTAQINNSRAKIGLQTDKIQQVTAGISQQSARMGLAEKVQQQKAQAAVGGASDAYYWKLDHELNDIKQRKANNEITAQEAVQLADRAYSLVNQTLSQAGRGAGSDYLSNVTAPLKGLYENSKQFLDGSIDEKVLNNRLNSTLAQSKLNLLGDPDVAKITATTQLLGPSVNALLPEINHQVVKIFGTNSDPSPDTKPHDSLPDAPQAKQDNKVYLGSVKANIAGLDAVPADKKAQTTDEINANLSNILRSIDVHSATVTNAADYNDVTDFLASPEYGKYAQGGGGLFTQAAENANTILQSQYIDKITPLVQKQYQEALVPLRNSNVYAPGPGPTSDQPTSAGPATAQIKPFFSGGGVVFRADPSANTAVKAKANDLNKQVTPIINKMVRMQAHLAGNTDYKASYDASFETIFGFGQKELTQPAETTNVKKTDTPPDRSTFGNREDGTAKGNGYLGVFNLPGGGVASEYSISTEDVQVNGKEADFPTLVPTLTQEERNLMINDIIPNGKQPPKAIIKKAADFAKKRLAEGKPLFATPEEEGKF